MERSVDWEISGWKSLMELDLETKMVLHSDFSYSLGVVDGVLYSK